MDGSEMLYECIGHDGAVNDISVSSTGDMVSLTTLIRLSYKVTVCDCFTRQDYYALDNQPR